LGGAEGGDSGGESHKLVAAGLGLEKVELNLRMYHGMLPKVTLLEFQMDLMSLQHGP
jgi:hypothetical protein